MGERIRAIDFWRGALQIVILVDHMSGSFLNRAISKELWFFGCVGGFRLSFGRFGRVGLPHDGK